MSIRIVFIHGLPENQATEWVVFLRRSLGNSYDLRTADQFTASELKVIEIAIVANPSPAELAKLPALLWVQSLWAGVDKLIEKTPENLKISRLVDPELERTMAEAVLTWTLYLHRKMHLYRNQQVNKIWEQHELLPPSQVNVGILGMGRLGQAAAQRLSDNGFCVSGFRRNKNSYNSIKVLYGESGLEELLKHSQILIILLPLTSETHHLINKRKLSLMPKGASIINFARSQILDNRALLESLNNQAIEHVVLDVFEMEPLPVTDALWEHPSITILPHIAATTKKSSASTIVAENIRNFAETGKFPDGTVRRPQGY